VIQAFRHLPLDCVRPRNFLAIDLKYRRSLVHCPLFVIMTCSSSPVGHGFICSAAAARRQSCRTAAAERFTSRFLPAGVCALRRQLVKFRPAIVFRLPPLRLKQPLAHEPEQGRIQCSLLHEQPLTGNLARSWKDGVTMERPERDGLRISKSACPA